MALFRQFQCDKCKTIFPAEDHYSQDAKPVNMVFRYSKGYTENNQYGGKFLQTIWCGECFNTLGIDLQEPPKNILPNIETVEDKIIYILEELGFTRGN